MTDFSADENKSLPRDIAAFAHVTHFTLHLLEKVMRVISRSKRGHKVLVTLTDRKEKLKVTMVEMRRMSVIFQ